MVYGFIVEGFNDDEKLKMVLSAAKTAITKGTTYNNRLKRDINALLEECDEVFILTDTDEVGDSIARRISEDYPDLKRIHFDINKGICMRHHKLKKGFEHCDVEYITEVFEEYGLL